MNKTIIASDIARRLLCAMADTNIFFRNLAHNLRTLFFQKERKKLFAIQTSIKQLHLIIHLNDAAPQYTTL